MENLGVDLDRALGLKSPANASSPLRGAVEDGRGRGRGAVVRRGRVRGELAATSIPRSGIPRRRPPANSKTGSNQHPPSKGTCERENREVEGIEADGNQAAMRKVWRLVACRCVGRHVSEMSRHRG